MKLDVFEIISVGNELLNGKVLNTNAYWLAKMITKLGGFVRCCTVVRDDVDDISSAIKESMKRKVNWLIVSGGLGPTYDDKTLQGIAKALNRELIMNVDALKMVEKKYEMMTYHGIIKKADLTQARMKMAKLPKGSNPLPNPIGTAPGVMINKGYIKIICLPGVPVEMKAIFKESIVPLIKKAINNFYYEKSIHTTGIVESDLAPLIEKVLLNNPLVYIKSYPKGYEEGNAKIEIQVTAMAEEYFTAKKRVKNALEQLKSMIIEHGGIIETKC
ncbi:MAG: nicotinamide mononucleotide deamidase-related protein [Nitrososphaerales archaeon]